MSDFSNLVFQVRYPYTAAVIATMWLGTACLLAVDSSLPIEQFVVCDSFASIIIALIGFTSPRR